MLSTLILGAGAALVAAAPPSYGKFPFDFHHGHYHHSFSFSTGASLVAPVATGTGTAPSFSAPIATGTGYPYAVSAFNATNTTSSYLTTGVGSSTAVVLSTGVSSSVVAPVAASAVAATSTGSSEVSAVSAASGCTFTDAASAISGKKSCTTIVLQDITVPAGTTLDMTDLEDGTTVVFAGTTTFEYEAWDGPLIYVSGTSITVQGETGHVIDGNGAKWWDGEGSNGGVTKPKFFYAHDLTDSTITGLNILNTPVQCFSVDNANNLKIVDVTIDDSAGDAGDLGHNTDAFDVGSSTGVYISGATVKNQDDCLAINSGTDISFTGGSCSGGHGLSIGSVGGRSDNTVENIYIASSSISNSENGVRIKTVSGATGSVKNVTYSGITLSDISDYGIVVEQDYENGDPTGTPTDGVPITDLTIEDITGSVSSGADQVYILCAACSDWTWTGVSITGGSTDSDCEGVPTGASC